MPQLSQINIVIRIRWVWGPNWDSQWATRDKRRTVQPITSSASVKMSRSPDKRRKKVFAQSTASVHTGITNYSLPATTHHMCTHVSCVPKKKIGILLGGGFTAPSATSSICKQTRRFGGKGSMIQNVSQDSDAICSCSASMSKEWKISNMQV